MVFSDDFRRKLNKILALAVVILSGLFVISQFDIFYDLNDDLVIRDILAGIYSGTAETRNMQMLYPLSFVLAVLYHLIPIIPWYGVLLGLSQAFCMYLLAERCFDFCARISGKLIMMGTIFMVWIGLFSYRFVFLHYTVTAGIMVATAIFRFMTNYSTDPDEVSFAQDTARVTKDDMRVGEFIKKNIINMILLIMAFMLRSEMALLLLPFVGAAFILKWAEEQPVFTLENFKKFGSLLLIVVLSCCFVLGVDHIAYSRANWSHFRDLFDARTELYDFTGIPDYEANKDFYDSIQVSQEEYDLLVSYNYNLSDNLNYQKFVAIADYALELQQKSASPSEKLRAALWQYLHEYYGKEYTPWIWISVVLSILVLAAALLQKQFQIIWKIILLNVLRVIPWIYIYYRGRIVERVTTPLLFMEMFIFGALLLMEFGVVVEKQNGYSTQLRRMRVLSKWEERRENVVRIFPIISLFTMLLIALIVTPIGYKATKKEFQNRNKISDLTNQINAHMAANENVYYLVDVYSSTSLTLKDSSDYAVISKKVYDDVSVHFGNYDILGGWIAKSPLYQDKLNYVEKQVVNQDSADLKEDSNNENVENADGMVSLEDSADGASIEEATEAEAKDNNVASATGESIPANLLKWNREMMLYFREQSYLGYRLIANPEGYQLVLRSDRDYSWLTNYYASYGIEVELLKIADFSSENTRDHMCIYKVNVVSVDERMANKILDENVPESGTIEFIDETKTYVNRGISYSGYESMKVKDMAQ